jgi:hypothetical protein
MKIVEVPQERGINPKNVHEICYAVDESGNYVLRESAGWEPKNIVNDQAWEIIKAQVQDVLAQIQAGRLSPLAFHMARNQMSVGLLSSYVRFGRWRVKRHLKPHVFIRLSTAVLRRYADVFEITVEELSNH